MLTPKMIAFTGAVAYLAAAAIYLRFGPKPMRQKCFAVAALSLAWLIPFLFLESLALLHLVDYRLVLATPFRKPWENPVNLLDSELLHIHRPHDVFTGEVPGDLVNWYNLKTTRRYQVDFRYDRNGFRNREELYTARVAVIGDSFIEGSLVAFEDLLTTRLAGLLQTPVLNLGQTGYGPQQQLAVLKRFAFPAQPETVVWVVFEGNDLTHDFRRYERATADWARYTRRLHGWSMRSFSRNALLFARRHLKPVPRDPTLKERRHGVLRLPDELRGERIYFGYEANPLIDSDEKSITGALHLFTAAKQACDERGVRFIMVLVPTSFRVYRDLCTFPPNSDALKWVLDDIPDRLGDWSKQAGAEFIDLTPALRDAARSELVFFLDDGHWNAAGHRVGAQEIAQRIKQGPAVALD